MEKELSSGREMNGIWEKDSKYEPDYHDETDNRYKTDSRQETSGIPRPDNGYATGSRQPVASDGSKYVHTRRVGSMTFGITLVCYGIFFLVHIFMPMLRYIFIFRCWPVVFILLGGEVLLENYLCRTQEWKMLYYFPAVLMLCAMLLFAMIMAAIDFVMYYEINYGTVFF